MHGSTMQGGGRHGLQGGGGRQGCTMHGSMMHGCGGVTSTHEIADPMVLRELSSAACMRVTWPAVNITIAASST